MLVRLIFRLAARAATMLVPAIEMVPSKAILTAFLPQISLNRVVTIGTFER